MKRFLAVAAVIALVGCSTTHQPSSGPSPFEPQMKEYINCNLSNSSKIARQSGDPVSLGVAAHGMCGRSAADLSEAMAAHRGPAFATDMMSSFERKQIQSNAALIARIRNQQ